jgi:hypothetical protein
MGFGLVWFGVGAVQHWDCIGVFFLHFARQNRYESIVTILSLMVRRIDYEREGNVLFLQQRID